jgi:putative endonuclease
MFVVYILYSTSADKYYVGHTNDIQRRLEEHNFISEEGYTRKHRPWDMVAIIKCGSSRHEAIRLERYIKSRKRREFIELVIQKQGDAEFLDYLRQKN